MVSTSGVGSCHIHWLVERAIPRMKSRDTTSGCCAAAGAFCTGSSMLAEGLCAAAPCVGHHQVLSVFRQQVMPLISLCMQTHARQVSHRAQSHASVHRCNSCCHTRMHLRHLVLQLRLATLLEETSEWVPRLAGAGSERMLRSLLAG